MAECADVVVACVGLDATLEGEEGDTGNEFSSGDKPTCVCGEPAYSPPEAGGARQAACYRACGGKLGQR